MTLTDVKSSGSSTECNNVVAPLERRLGHRVQARWLEMKGDRAMPSPKDINPDTFGSDWNWCFVLDVARSADFPYFVHMGWRLSAHAGLFVADRTDWSKTVLEIAKANMPKTVDAAAPTVVEDELELFDGRILLFRSVLFPLSADSECVTHVLGAANGKVVEAE